MLLSAFLNFLASFFSSIQESVIHAFRIESLSDDEQVPGVSLFYAFWRIASVLAVSGTITVAYFFHTHLPGTVTKDQAWTWAYVLASLTISLGILGTLLAREEDLTPKNLALFSKPFWERLRQAVVVPIRTFINRQGWPFIFLFVALHKMGDILAMYMLPPFLVHKGYGLKDYGFLGSTLGLLFVGLGAFGAHALLRTMPPTAAALAAGVAQNVIHFYFVLLVFLPVHFSYLALAVMLEHFCLSLATITFVVWVSQLCQDRNFTATELSLFFCIAASVRTFLPAPMGYMVVWIGYGGFFLFTVGFGLLSLLPLVAIKNPENKAA